MGQPNNILIFHQKSRNNALGACHTQSISINPFGAKIFFKGIDRRTEKMPILVPFCFQQFIRKVRNEIWKVDTDYPPTFSQQER